MELARVYSFIVNLSSNFNWGIEILQTKVTYSYSYLYRGEVPAFMVTLSKEKHPRVQPPGTQVLQLISAAMKTDRRRKMTTNFSTQILLFNTANSQWYTPIINQSYITSTPTPQAVSYGSRSEKNNVFVPVGDEGTSEFPEDLPPLLKDPYDDSDIPDEIPQDPTEAHETIRDGTRLYRLARIVLGSMPTISVSLSCGVTAPSIGVEGPLDKGTTMCYFEKSLLKELQPFPDPTSIKCITFKVPVGALPDHILDHQVDLRVLLTHAGHTYGAILRFVGLQTDILRIIIFGFHSIPLVGLLEPLIVPLRNLQRLAQQASSMFLLGDTDHQEPKVHALRVILTPQASSRPSGSENMPLIGLGIPPNTVPDYSQFAVAFASGARTHQDLIDERHVLVRQLYAIRSELRALRPEAQLRHNVSLQLLPSVNRFSDVPIIQPFYWMVLNHTAPPRRSPSASFRPASDRPRPRKETPDDSTGSALQSHIQLPLLGTRGGEDPCLSATALRMSCRSLFLNFKVRYPVETCLGFLSTV